MSRNVILSISIITLISISYFLFEKNDLALTHKQEKQILDFKSLGKIKNFKSKHFIINYESPRYTVQKNKSSLKELASLSQVQVFMNFLEKIHFTTTIEHYDRTEYIPNNAPWLEFLFEKEKVKFTLGEKINYSPDFYIEVTRGNKSLIVVARDLNDGENLYQKDSAHSHSASFSRVSTIFNLPLNFFTEKNILSHYILPDYKKLLLEKVYIENFKGNAYSVNFKLKNTNPTPASFLKINKNSFNQLYSSLLSLNSINITSNGDQKLLSQELARLKLTTVQQIELNFSLFNKFMGKPGYYLFSHTDSKVFQLERTFSEFMFLNKDHYWDLKILKPNMPIRMPLQKPKLADQLKELFSKPASFLQTSPNLESYKKKFDIMIGNNDFEIYHKKQELLLFSKNEKVGLFYFIGDLKF